MIARAAIPLGVFRASNKRISVSPIGSDRLIINKQAWLNVKEFS